MRSFNIPTIFQSNFISQVKEIRSKNDPRKRDFSPSIIDFKNFRLVLARHFGFCYGVQNAIEIAYQAIEENPSKRIFLLSEMIHNAEVNQSLQKLGVQYVMDTKGNTIIDWNNLTKEDIVIVPAFGTSIEIEEKLKSLGIDPYKYNTTCPFVDKVWKRAKKLGDEGFSIIIHGKHQHEETRASFSHSSENTAALVIKNLKEAKVLADFILGKISKEDFLTFFEGKFSENFDAEKSLEKIGVVNQTTMLATETQEIVDYLREIYIEKHGETQVHEFFANTRDTLCYATNDNQNATLELVSQPIDLAFVVGGYNSSNTSHIFELVKNKIPNTFYIEKAEKILSKNELIHFDFESKTETTSMEFLPEKSKPTIAITSGASCPDSTLDKIIEKIAVFYDDFSDFDEVLSDFAENNSK